MESKFHYTDERNVQIVIALLKAHGIHRVIASPGTTNMTFVVSVQNDPWFKLWSSVDERSDLAAFSPHLSLKKKSLFHVMIHKYLSGKYAQSVKKNYDDLNIIFCHVSNRSVSVAAHKKGKTVDVNQAFMGFGPMGLCEIGTLPSSDIVDMIYKKCYSKNEILLCRWNYVFYV